MSTLKADTIQSTGGGVATLTKQNAAKVFGQYDASVNVGTPSLNISSVTDTGTGQHRPNFTNAMSSTGFSITEGITIIYSTTAVVSGIANTETTTTKIEIQTFKSGDGANTDVSQVHFNIHGDLA